MNEYIDVIFPTILTRADPFTNNTSLSGPSYLNVKSIYDKTLITYKNTTASYTLASTTYTADISNLLNIGLINNVKTKIINDSIKLHIKGLLLSADNGFCINEFLILKIPNTNNSNIVYQHHISLWKYQGTFGCNYLYKDNVLTIIALYFTAVRNPFFQLNTSNTTIITTS